MPGTLLILGLGNTILTDDAAGIETARRVHEAVSAAGIRADFSEASYAGWRLMELFDGYDRVVVIDSMMSGKAAPGECRRVEAHKDISIHLRSSHGMGLDESVALARRNGQHMPQDVAVYGIEVANPYDFGETMTPAVAAGIPAAVREISEEIVKWVSEADNIKTVES